MKARTREEGVLDALQDIRCGVRPILTPYPLQDIRWEVHPRDSEKWVSGYNSTYKLHYALCEFRKR